MSDHISDPFTESSGPAPAKPFAIGYKRANGEGIVYGAMLFAFGFLVLGLFGGAKVLTSLSLIPIFVAYWYYPMVDRGQPQLGANKDGLFLERLGFLSWDAISSLDLKATAVRTIDIKVLKITLNRPLEEAIAKPQVFPVWKAVMTRNWKVRKASGDGSPIVEVNLHTLNGEPDEILTRLRQFRPV